MLDKLQSTFFWQNFLTKEAANNPDDLDLLRNG